MKLVYFTSRGGKCNSRILHIHSLTKETNTKTNTRSLPMNKTELINSLSEETTFSKKDISRVLDALTRIVVRTLKRGDKVQLSGFGTFGVVKRRARMGINPMTKQRIPLKETVAPKFKPGKNFKEMIRASK
jgi:DNA-binding protein HU-beta